MCAFVCVCVCVFFWGGCSIFAGLCAGVSHQNVLYATLPPCTVDFVRFLHGYVSSVCAEGLPAPL